MGRPTSAKLNKMSQDLSDEDLDVAKEVAAPIILRILNRFTAEDIAHAVKTDLNIITWLKNNRRARWTLKAIITPFSSFFEEVAPYLKSKKWISWFIHNELAHKRPDLYNQFIYDPKAYDWLYRTMVNLSKFLVEQ